MKAKRKWLWLLLLVPLTGVSWQIYNYTLPEPPPATSVFAEAGFLTLRLTMNYHAPGSLYTVDSQSEGFVSLDPTCEVDADELKNAIQVHRTTDVSAAIEHKLSAGFKVAPENWSKLGIEAELAGVQNILAIYSDSKVELLSTEKIRTLRDSYLRRPRCFASVKEMLEGGFEVCQTKAVIVSDLVYEVTRSARSNFRFGVVIDKIFGLGGQSTADNSVTIKSDGSKMYHAVKLHRSKLGTCLLLNTATTQTGGSEPMPASGYSAAAVSNSG